MKEKLAKNWPHVLALVAAVAAVVVLPFVPISWEALRGYGYLGIFIINLVGSATVFFPVPGLAAAFVGGGVSLNALGVTLAGSAGSTIGEITGYLAGYGGQAVLERNKHYARVEEWMCRFGDATVFVMAAIPNPLFDVAGMVSGSLKFPLWRFLLAAFLGKVVKYAIFTLLGAVSMERLLPLLPWSLAP